MLLKTFWTKIVLVVFDCSILLYMPEEAAWIPWANSSPPSPSQEENRVNEKAIFKKLYLQVSNLLSFIVVSCITYKEH